MRLRVNNLNFAYGQKKIIHNLSFSIPSGAFLSIVGKNGTGKSTLVKTLLRLTPALSGRITYDHTIKNTMGYLQQNLSINEEFPATVYEIVLSVEALSAS